MIVSASSTPTSSTTTTTTTSTTSTTSTTTTTISSNDRDNIQYDIYNKGKTTLSYTRIFTLPRIEASIYEHYNPMKDNMSNWLVVSRAATPSFIRRETWREFRDIRYNLSIQHGSYEGYSPGNWNYFSLYYDYSYVPYGVWFIVYPPNSNGVMVNIGNYFCRLLSGIRP